MVKHLIFSMLLTAFCGGSFELFAQDNSDSTSLGRKVDKGIELFQTGKEVWKIFRPSKSSNERSSQPPQTSENRSSNSSPQPSGNTMKSSNNPIVLDPNASKTALMNGSNVSVSNKMGDYTLKITDCRGSLSDQTVTIYFTVKHGLANQYFSMRDSKCSAYAEGVSYGKFSNKVAGKRGGGDVPYQVEIKCEATIRFVPPSTESFDSISIDLYTKNSGSHSGIKSGNLELRNLKVVWQ